MKNCTPLWRAAHVAVEVKMYKTHQGRNPLLALFHPRFWASEVPKTSTLTVFFGPECLQKLQDTAVLEAQATAATTTAGTIGARRRAKPYNKLFKIIYI